MLNRNGEIRVLSWLSMKGEPSGSEASEECKDEVLKKLGRNLLGFQEAEHQLKWLAARKQISGMSDELKSIAEKTHQQVAKDTLGGALRRTTEDAHLSERDREKIEAAVAEHGGVHLELSFDFFGPDGERDTSWHKPLEALLEARNGLVHHFLEQFDLATPEGCRAAADHLDGQREEYSPVVADLGQRCEHVAQAAEMHAAALKQPDIRAEILHGPLRIKLESQLQKVATEKARDDGWTYLNLAGQKLAADAPELFRRLRMAFGYSGLKEAVAAMDQFELREEPTDAGIGVLYRCR